MLMKLAIKSLLDRKGSVVLALMAMSASVFVLLGVENLRQQTKSSFANTVSGVDLIVGARTGGLNLLLYSVFRVGAPTNNIHWQSYATLAKHHKVEWSVPISLGDSHKGYRVLGTTRDYFQYFKYGKQHPLEFGQGRAFGAVFEVVLGAQVAAQLGYQLGDQLLLSHGMASTSFSQHDQHPFTLVGILKATGTPVDQTLLVSLQGLEAVHANWRHHPNMSQTALTDARLQPQSITAFMLGLKSKMSIFQVQRAINEYAQEPLSAIIPGVVLSELWQMMGLLENTLWLVSGLVFIAACLGMSAMLFSTIRERNREIQLLRAIGAPAYFLFLLIQLEALLMTLLSCLIGAGSLFLCLLLFQDDLVARVGVTIEASLLTDNSLTLGVALILASIVVALIPSYQSYRKAS